MDPQPLRLLYVSHSFPPAGRPLANVGGMQRVATELHDAFRNHSVTEVTDLVLRTSWRWTHIRTVPFLVKLLFKVPRLVTRHDIDAVLFSSMVTGSVAVYLDRHLQGRDVRLAAITHGRDVTLPLHLYQQFVPSVFDALDVVLPVSEATAGACMARGLPASKCRVVPNGVDPDRFDCSRPEAANGQADRGRQMKLLSVGRQVKRKGFTWFVREVMPALPDFVHYYLAGDGPEHETIEQTARSAGVRQRVHLLGRVSEDRLIRLYHSSDLYIMPNIPISGDMEGFGVVMLEAGICGLPTVASRLEGIQDVIADGQNGHLIEPQDPAAFIKTIRPYAEDPTLLTEASARAKRFVREHFTWSSVVDQYVDVLATSIDRDTAVEA